MSLSLLSWKSVARNSLKGFATVRYGSLKISDISVHNNGTRRWANLPSKPLIAADGSVKRDSKGKAQYVPIMEWDSREAADKFSDAVLEAVEREYPNSTSA